MTAFPNFPESCVRALCVGPGPEIRNTEYGIRNGIQNARRSTDDGSWPRPRPRIWHFGDSGCGYNNGSGCKLPALPCVAVSLSRRKHSCEGGGDLGRGSYGCFGGRDLHSASQFVFPKSAGAQPRTRTRIRMRIRIRTRLRPTRTANDNAAQWEETHFYWTKLNSLLFSNYLASYKRYFLRRPITFIGTFYVCAILSSIRRVKY